jgi:predicted thioesterase
MSEKPGPPYDLHAGQSRDDTYHVEERHSAPHVGSGAVRVLATPWMIAFMERTAHRLLADHLPEGSSSVGFHLDVHHTAPTPVGETVHVLAEVTAVEGPRVTLAVQARDEHELVGKGTHQRAVIDVARFMRRVQAKIQVDPD